MHGLRGKKLRLGKENFSNDLFNAIKTTMEVLVVFIKAGCQKELCVKLRLHDPFQIENVNLFSILTGNAVNFLSGTIAEWMRHRT